MVNNCPSLELASIVQSLTDSIESSVEPTNLRKTSPPVLRGGSFLWNQACANDQQNLLYRGPRYNTEIGQGPVFGGGRFPGTPLRPIVCKFCYTADRGIINVRQRKAYAHSAYDKPKVKTLKILIVIVFAGSIIPTIVMQKETPLWLRYTACSSLLAGVVVGAIDILSKKKHEDA